MKKILVLSVGSSANPIIHAIQNYKPDFVYFFCSSGGSESIIDSPGDPCGNKQMSTCPQCSHTYYLGDPRGKAIIVQTGLEKGQYEIITVDDPDDLNVCHTTLLELAETIQETFGPNQVIANYTGGTKTMSVALALVGIMTHHWELSLNKAPRLDLIKITSGDVPVGVDKWRIFSQNQLDFLRGLLDNYYYGFVASFISDMLLRPLDKPMQDRLIEARVICEAFNLWDTFNHCEALGLLEPYGSRLFPYIINAKKILGKSKATGYELVSDLLNNAERRASQNHYDDAIARLYRAIELFAQTRLEKEFGYQSGELRLEQLPGHLQAQYNEQIREGKLLLGLRDDYDLLFKLDDSFGIAFKEKEARLVDAIKRRNSSISGGHGVTPLREEDYVYVKERLLDFILETADRAGLNIRMEQLPGREILNMN